MDINGRVIETVEVYGAQGLNTVQFSTVNLAPGVYLYSLNAGKYSKTKKLIVK